MFSEMSHVSPYRERLLSLLRLFPGLGFGLWLALTPHWLDNAAPMTRIALYAGVCSYCLASLALMVDCIVSPQPKGARVVLGIVLETVAISTALHLGAGTLDPIALGYLWIMLCSGFLYGPGFLVLASGLGALAFAAVWAASAYWQHHDLFALTIVGVQLGLGGYIYTLIATLHRNRREVLWQANHDALTGLLNRRALTSALQSRLPNLESGVLLYIDLDHFKQVNDQAGHAAGDQVLRDVTAMFEQRTPDHRLVARLGGDEFCILLDNMGLTRARAIAEKIRCDIATYRLAWAREYYTIGVSIGLAQLQSTDTVPDWLQRADAACYCAKRAGRNLVKDFDPSMISPRLPERPGDPVAALV
ncbi:MAG: GGDEF domain-containing protein [Pseudomonadota bacterium]